MTGSTPREAATLILIPTAGELKCLDPERLARAGSAPLVHCGFGPIAAAASTVREVARLQPQRVLLVGIAGSFDLEHHPVGSAAGFGEVRVDGIGAGEGRDAQSAEQLGLPQWPDAEGGGGVFDTMPLHTLGPKAHPTLLTVCSCSASSEQAQRRQQRFEHPAGEDMEGFGVAMACHQLELPLAIVRGFSNVVGDRNPRNWRIAPAMHAAWDLALDLLAAPDWESPL